MKGFVICEGKTDAVIVNHIMTSIGFKYDKRIEMGFKLKLEKQQETDYLKKDDKLLGIWSVAGFNNIKKAVENIQEINKEITEEPVDVLVILIDRDFKEINDLEKEVQSYFENSITLKNNCWSDYFYQDSFGRNEKIKILLKIIPTDKFGALETLLINALKTDKETIGIGEAVEKFIDELKIELKPTRLEKERNVIKSKLGCFVNILDPERTFKDIIKVFDEIKWQDNSVIIENFKEFLEMEEE